jgi:YbbR domain-containing protein
MLRNVGLKIVSIALASLLWLLVSGEQIVERVLRIPLEFTNLPSQLELVGEPTNVVDVRVRGSAGALSRIAAGELVAVLDLRTARPGPQRLFHLTGGDVRAPFGVEVLQVSPSTISIAFEPSASKVVPVVPAVDGEPAAGYEVGTVTAEPAMVEVVGPVSAIERLTEAITEPVSVAGASASVTESVTVGVAEPSVRVRNTEGARVTATVRPAPVEWAVRGVPVSVRSGARPGGTAVTVAPAAVTVYVRGPRASMSSGAAEFEASIDVAGLQPGQYQLPVHVTPPGRVGVVRVDPPQLRVVIGNR